MAPGKVCSSFIRTGRNCNRSAANERERKRMQSLSRVSIERTRDNDDEAMIFLASFPCKAFTTLRAVIPWIPSDTKLSKLDTLTAAIEYIAWLDQLLLLPRIPDCAVNQDPIQSIAQHKKVKTPLNGAGRPCVAKHVKWSPESTLLSLCSVRRVV